MVTGISVGSGGSDRVALVDHHLLFAEALGVVLRTHGYDARLVATGHAAEEGEESRRRLLTAILRERPSIVLIDVDAATMTSRLELIESLSTAGIAVVVVTGTVDRARWGECVERGAYRVIPTYAALSDIVATLARIRAGLPALSAGERRDLVARRHLRAAAQREASTRLALLSPREGEVLAMLMSGLQVGDIAVRRTVSTATVRSQVKAVLAKLEVGSQVSAVAVAHRAGWEPAATVAEALRRRDA